MCARVQITVFCHSVFTLCRTQLKAIWYSLSTYIYCYSWDQFTLETQLAKLREMNIQLNLSWISFRYLNKLNLWLVHLWNKLFYMGVKYLCTMGKFWSHIHTCVATRSIIIQEFEKLAMVSALNCFSIGTFYSSKSTLDQTCLSCMSVLEDNENAELKYGIVPSILTFFSEALKVCKWRLIYFYFPEDFSAYDFFWCI